jgi:type I restriction enzyme M protein
MAIKKSELCSSLWSSCDELRGGMDASQYKHYVLVLLFIKYISDKYAAIPYAAITIPTGASFKDMVALKGKSDIGDQINKKIIAPLANANELADMPNFNDATKLGSGKEMVDRLTNLIAILENPALDFSKNRAESDDILGDAYEYLMRHFVTESGKRKGHFYTPAEVSRVIAQTSSAFVRTSETAQISSPLDPEGRHQTSDQSSTPSPIRTSKHPRGPSLPCRPLWWGLAGLGDCLGPPEAELIVADAVKFGGLSWRRRSEGSIGRPAGYTVIDEHLSPASVLVAGWEYADQHRRGQGLARRSISGHMISTIPLRAANPEWPDRTS